MSLIKCRECGSDVSTQAKVCQRCGAPVKAVQNGQSIAHKIARAVVLIGLALLCIFVYLSDRQQRLALESSSTASLVSVPQNISAPIQEAAPEKEKSVLDRLISNGKAFAPSTYAKGDIPQGEYAFVSDKGGYYSEEINGQIIDNQNFPSFGYVYCHGIGNVTSRGYLISVNSIQSLGSSGALGLYAALTNQPNYNFSGYYKVGVDIKPGLYKINSIDQAYVSVNTGPVGNSQVLANDLFKGSKTLQLRVGSYLEVNKATIVMMGGADGEQSTPNADVRPDENK